MIEKVEVEEFMCLAGSLPIIDVRSPGEYDQGHIPSAINLPLFDDSERAIIGTIYKNSGRESAILKGFEFAGPKLAGFIKKMVHLAPNKEFLIHCWRGGMRSEQMSWLFDQAGLKPRMLTGGYKAYRHFIREALFKEAKIIVIGGLTGSGKTDILRQLSQLGEQIIDLEKIACHKGSVFGGMGQEVQPSNEQFENNIYDCWRTFDPEKRIWIEDESRAIGKVTIPDALLYKITSSPMIRIEISAGTRLNRIVKEYSGCDPQMLKEAFFKISGKLGGTRTGQALDALDQNDFYLAVELALAHYDKSYRHSISKRDSQAVYSSFFYENDSVKNALQIREFANNQLFEW